MGAELIHQPGQGESLVDIWEAFGCTPPNRSDTEREPVVRIRHQNVTRLDAETVSGIVCVSLDLYGDEPHGGGFLKVEATSGARARDLWERVAETVPHLSAIVWKDTPQ